MRGEVDKGRFFRGKNGLTWQAEERIWFGGHADADQSLLGLIIDFAFPVVYFILFRDGQVAQDAAFAIKEFNLRPCLDEAICNLKFGLKLPCRYAFLLDGEILG